MYPYFRFAAATWQARRQAQHDPFRPLVSQHRCWPWDLDPWGELNNGRTLTLYDLGRVPLAKSMGLTDIARSRGWGTVVAGVSVRYRRRVRPLRRFQMLSRLIGWDRRFFYIEQSLWLGGECANHMLLRSAVTTGVGIVPPGEVVAALGFESHASPPLPDWVTAWIEAEAMRPWPPEYSPDAMPNSASSAEPKAPPR